MAIGFLEVAGYGTALYALDKACKTADISILGIDTINPKDTSANIPLTVQVKVEGDISDVAIAMEVAGEEALRFNTKEEIITAVIDNPYGGTKKLANISKVKIETEQLYSAVGVVEISFLTNAIVMLDELLKTSDVKLVGCEKTLGGRMVTIIVEGTVSAVDMAMQRAEGMNNKDLKVAVTISKPHPELTKLFRLKTG